MRAAGRVVKWLTGLAMVVWAPGESGWTGSNTAAYSG
jgi:hypothetical protein